MLDLYHRRYDNKPLKPDEYVISTDEKTSIQARCRCRCHHPLPPTPGRPARVEHEYQRRGALAYLAALDVHHATVIGRCEDTTGIVPFSRLIEQIMTTEPTRPLDACSSPTTARRTVGRHHRSHGQSLAHREAGAPAHPRLLAQPDRDLLLHHPSSNARSSPPTTSTPWPTASSASRTTGSTPANLFEWKFTRTNLNALLARINDHEPLAAAA